mgnify:CR=1 FL=1
MVKAADRRILWLMRHGALAAEHDGKLVGASDLPLSQRGIDDVQTASTFLIRQGPFGTILASPKLRVRQTVDAVLTPELRHDVVFDPVLSETDFGAWEGLTIAEAARRDPECFAAWASGRDEFTFPGGESMTSFNARIAALKDRLVADAAEKMLLFTHGGVILGLLCAFLGLPRNKMVAFKLERGALCRIDIFPGGLGALVAFNLKPGDFAPKEN